MSQVRRSATVRGVVQGVSFRWYMRREAERRRLTGWVRNDPDGSVRLEVQGPEEALEGFLGWVRQGPSHARVASVDVDDVPPREAEVDFRIVA